MWEALRTVRKYLWRYRAGLAVGGVCLVAKRCRAGRAAADDPLGSG